MASRAPVYERSRVVFTKHGREDQVTEELDLSAILASYQERPNRARGGAARCW
jgi:hypothetical protein